MSKLILQMKVENVFKSKDFEDKKTGEIKPAKWKIQGFDNVDTAQGMQIKLIDVSVPDEIAFDLKDKIGQEVSIEVGTFVNNGRVGFYGI